MVELERLLVGLDGSKASLNALDYALDFSKALSLPLVGIFVLDERILEEALLSEVAGILGFSYPGDFYSKVEEVLRKQANLVLEEFTTKARSEGLVFSTYETRGVPHKVLVEQARERDVLFLGKRGKKVVEGYLLGSTTERVLRQTKSFVFVCGEEKVKVERVCLAYDGRKASRRLLPLLDNLRKVYTFKTYVLFVDEGKGEVEKIRREVEENLEDFTFVVREGFCEEEILNFCKEEGISLLMMGAFSRPRLYEFFLGSTTSYLLQNLEIPFILSRAP